MVGGESTTSGVMPLVVLAKTDIPFQVEEVESGSQLELVATNSTWSVGE